ncbi:hypothetical protein VTL71DRAFT_2614 [Oculimacula yallundae]|uniref:Uncharacterized protein n=1 Tax=Oculimacula yallundae TaxID=86028 RepID=A0ABR4C9C1_9HELO
MACTYTPAPGVYCCKETISLPNSPTSEELMSKHPLKPTLSAFTIATTHPSSASEILLGSPGAKATAMPPSIYITKVTQTTLSHASPDLKSTAGLGARYYAYILLEQTNGPTWVEFDFAHGDGLDTRFTESVVYAHRVCGKHQRAFKIDILEDASQMAALAEWMKTSPKGYTHDIK